MNISTVTPTPWTCADTDASMEAYRIGQLEASVADQLFDHILRCQRCNVRHWRPFHAEATWMIDDFLDALAGPGPQPDGSPATFVDDQRSLSLTDWTSSGELSRHQAQDRPRGATALTNLPGLPDEAGQSEGEAELELSSGPLLRLVGTVLPRVPRRKLISAYTIYLGDGLPRPDRTSHTHASLRVEAEGKGERVNLEALSEDVWLDGEPVVRAHRTPLRGTHLLEIGEERYLFEAVSRTTADWMGAGLLRHRGPGWPLTDGPIRMGRGEGNHIPLPDRVVRTNLELRPGAFESLTDPLERQQLVNLTLDAFEVSREHAVLEWVEGRLELRAASDHAVFVLGGDGATSTHKLEQGLEVRPGSELKVGQRLFEFRMKAGVGSPL